MKIFKYSQPEGLEKLLNAFNSTIPSNNLYQVGTDHKGRKVSKVEDKLKALKWLFHVFTIGVAYLVASVLNKLASKKITIVENEELSQTDRRLSSLKDRIAQPQDDKPSQSSSDSSSKKVSQSVQGRNKQQYQPTFSDLLPNDVISWHILKHLGMNDIERLEKMGMLSKEVISDYLKHVAFRAAVEYKHISRHHITSHSYYWRWELELAHASWILWKEEPSEVIKKIKDSINSNHSAKTNAEKYLRIAKLEKEFGEEIYLESFQNAIDFILALKGKAGRFGKVDCLRKEIMIEGLKWGVDVSKVFKDIEDDEIKLYVLVNNAKKSPDIKLLDDILSFSNFGSVWRRFERITRLCSEAILAIINHSDDKNRKIDEIFNKYFSNGIRDNPAFPAFLNTLYQLKIDPWEYLQKIRADESALIRVVESIAVYDITIAKKLLNKFNIIKSENVWENIEVISHTNNQMNVEELKIPENKAKFLIKQAKKAKLESLKSVFEKIDENISVFFDVQLLELAQYALNPEKYIELAMKSMFNSDSPRSKHIELLGLVIAKTLGPINGYKILEQVIEPKNNIRASVAMLWFYLNFKPGYDIDILEYMI